MTRRKGEIDVARSRADGRTTLRCRPRRFVALRTAKPRGVCWHLSVASLTYSLRRCDHNFAVFCFAKPEDAQAFAQRFGGEWVANPAIIDNPGS